MSGKGYKGVYAETIRDFCVDDPDGCAKARRTLLSWNALTYLSQAITSGTFFTVLLIAMGASEAYIGYVTMATTLCMALQFLAPLFWERRARRKSLLVKISILGHVLTYLGLPCAAILPVAPYWRLAIYMALTLITGAITQFCQPALNAWTMQSIPFSKRISYTSLISVAQLVINVVSVFLAGVFLDCAEAASFSLLSLSPELTAIFLLRLLACVASVWSVVLLARNVKEYAYGTEGEGAPKPSLAMLMEPMKNRPFLAVILLPCLWLLIGGMIGNYFSLHLIENVKMSYTLISSASVISTPIVLLITPFWTRLLHRRHWLKTLAWAILGYCVAYLCNVFIAANALFFYFAAIFLGNFFAPGINIVNNNLLYVHMPDNNRTTYFAFYSLLSTVCTLIGQALGTLFVTMSSSVHLDVFGISVGNLQLVSGVAAFFGVLLALGIFLMIKLNPSGTDVKMRMDQI